MKTKPALVICAAAAALTTATAANASGGCGFAFHRNPFGACVPNRGGPIVVAPGFAVGVFYPGRGYWDGHRFWRQRYAWHGGWRYR